MKIITNIGYKILATALFIALTAGISAASSAKTGGSAPKGSENRSAIGFSHAKYARVLGKYVDKKGLVNYKGLKADRKALDEYLVQIAELDKAEFNGYSENDRIAFLINAYNAVTLKSIIDEYPIKGSGISGLRFPKNSIRQIKGVWDKNKHRVLRGNFTLDDIEHKQLRANYNEPRIHMALVCASIGCPLLRNEPYTGEKLDAQLKEQTERFLKIGGNFRIDRGAEKVYISSIFKWFGDDFINKYAPARGFSGSKSEKASLNFISKHISSGDASYLAGGGYKVKYLDYDWGLNEQ